MGRNFLPIPKKLLPIPKNFFPMGRNFLPPSLIPDISAPVR
jgi:hypothetical protein